jgi:Zn-dependent oligopeptidase
LKREQTKNASAVLEPWDAAYFRKEYVKKKLDFSEEQLKEYYPLNHVVKTTLDIY